MCCLRFGPVRPLKFFQLTIKKVLTLKNLRIVVLALVAAVSFSACSAKGSSPLPLQSSYSVHRQGVCQNARTRAGGARVTSQDLNFCGDPVGGDGGGGSACLSLCNADPTTGGGSGASGSNSLGGLTGNECTSNPCSGTDTNGELIACSGTPQQCANIPCNGSQLSINSQFQVNGVDMQVTDINSLWQTQAGKTWQVGWIYQASNGARYIQGDLTSSWGINFSVNLGLISAGVSTPGTYSPIVHYSGYLPTNTGSTRCETGGTQLA